MHSLKKFFNYDTSQIDFFSIKSINVNIPLNNINTCNIVSYTCDQSINNWELVDNSVRLNISFLFKILYTVPNSSALSIFKYEYYCYDLITLPNKIDGFDLHKINIKKKLKPICDIISMSLLNYDTSYILISLIIINKIEILHSLSIIYNVIDEKSQNFLYASDILFKNLIQLNFSHRDYKHICFSYYEDCFYYYINDNIYQYLLLTNNEVFLFNDSLLKWFCNISKNKFIIYRNNEFNNYIILVDIKNNLETLIYKFNEKSKIKSFNFSNNILSFIVSTEEKEHLIILDIYNDILLNKECTFNDIYINTSHDILIGTNKNNLQLINVIDKSTTDVLIPFNDFIINNLVFFSSNIIIISGIYNNVSYILSLDIKNLLFNELLKGNFIISSLEVDNRGNIIFSSNQLKLFNIYIMKPGEKPKLALKLFSPHLNLLVRK
ncbi:hypothetical protein [Clostridium weizhouense]|uniref:Uncharacterized protein n=1 Tax=Clostridium weizhouense TaxID=2859781 RepID=A0ABS7AKS7_9CLOT|nr:hypothetical protein [Clostridium weizhouense]MBW6409259.1 hypothetical protein [Clostridium weizhouense]